ALEDDILITNGRIMKAKIGAAELRDSYSLMPFSLATYEKDAIEYWKMEKEHRENYRDEILSYLRSDCVYLQRLITKWHELFGQEKITVGSTAMQEIRKRHKFKRADNRLDA